MKFKASLRLNKDVTTLKQDLSKLDVATGRRFPMTIFALSLTSLALSLIQAVLTFLGFFPKLSLGLFKNGISEVYNSHRINITPNLAFYLMVPTYALPQFSWIGYTLASVFWRRPSGAAIVTPPVLSASFFVLYNISTLFSIAWPLLFDRNLLFESAIAESLAAVTLFPAYCIAGTRYYYYKREFVREKRVLDMFVYQWGILNGLAMQWAYAIVSFIVAMGVLLAVAISTPPAIELASNISLGVLALIMTAYTTVDVTIMQPVFRRVFSPYFAMLWALGSITLNNWDPSKISSMMSLGMIGVTGLSLALKIAVNLYHARRKRKSLDVFYIKH